MARGTQERLDDVGAAIAAIEKGAQSYTTVLGTVVTRANLATLYAQRNELQGLVDLAAINGGEGPTRMEVGLSGIDRAF